MSGPGPMRTGYEAYTAHVNCALYDAYAPAHTLCGADAIKYYLPPERQDALQFSRPHDADRVDWMRGWDKARADAAAGRVDVDSAEDSP